jgi:hypothetical protein
LVEQLHKEKDPMIYLINDVVVKAENVVKALELYSRNYKFDGDLTIKELGDCVLGQSFDYEIVGCLTYIDNIAVSEMKNGNIYGGGMVLGTYSMVNGTFKVRTAGIISVSDGTVKRLT